MGSSTAKYGPGAQTRKKVTTTDILARKKAEKITSVTAYDYSTAKLVDTIGIDVILVGDSLGMVVLGYFAKVYADVGASTRDALELQRRGARRSVPRQRARLLNQDDTIAKGGKPCCRSTP